MKSLTTRLTRKRLILAGIVLLVLLAIIYGFLPEPTPVDTAAVERGSLQVIVEEEGETRVAESYVVSSPVPAFARRIELDPGDPVEQGQPIVRLEPPRAALLDPRTAAEARARVETAAAGLTQARQNVESAEAVAAQAEEERVRVENLYKGGSATRQQLTQARSAAEQAQANVEAAEAAVRGAAGELEAAQAAASMGSAAGAQLRVAQTLRSPVTGRVLSVHRESAGQVSPGEPLIEIGNVGNLEVHVDVLSQDAVRIAPGTRVLLEQWGGAGSLEATVRRVDPQGFTAVSSLGVEEQRVTVVAQPTFTPAGLGASYRVLARFVVWEGDNILLVPTAALFRTDEGWATFVVEGGFARRRDVEIGQQSGLAAEVLSGLREGDEVVVHPESDLADGTRVERR